MFGLQYVDLSMLFMFLNYPFEYFMSQRFNQVVENVDAATMKLGQRDRIFMTGARGYIGSVITEQSCRVLCLAQ